MNGMVAPSQRVVHGLRVFVALAIFAVTLVLVIEQPKGLGIHLVRTCHERWILSDAKRTKRAVRIAKAKRSDTSGATDGRRGWRRLAWGSWMR